jgi:hypothetical protein
MLLMLDFHREFDPPMSRTQNGHAKAIRADTTRYSAQPDRLSRNPVDYHAVRFYDSDASLAGIVSDFLSEGFAQGSLGMVIATPSQRTSIVQALTDRSLDVVALQRSHDLQLLDAEETLRTFMTDGQPNPRHFRNQMCRMLEELCGDRANCPVRIFGQMVDVLWQRGERDAAIRLEVLWNELARTEAFSLLCGYAIGTFYKDTGVEEICAHHSHVVSPDGKATRVAAVARDSTRRQRGRRDGG